MFELDADWWQFPARAAIVYVALLVMMRATGRRTIGQFTPFDMLVMLLLSESVSNALSGGDQSVPGGLLSAASLILLNAGVGMVTARSRRIERLVEGTPVLIGRDGRVFHDVLVRHRIGQEDIEKTLREAECEVDDIDCAFLEADGSISIRKKKPSD